MDSLIFITLLKDIKLFREKILSSAIFLWLKRKSVSLYRYPKNCGKLVKDKTD